MSILLSNFLRRLGDFLHQNRARVIKWLLILAAVLIGAWLIYYGVERFHAWRYEKAVEAKDREFRAAEAKINAAEAVINALKVEIAAKDALIEELDKQANAAQKVVEKTRTVYVSLKDEYEKTRDNPNVPADISNCGACAELARAGHPCK